MLHIPDIVAGIRALEVPVIGRKTVEELFGVKRRHAASLMQRFGGYRSGNTMLADWAALIQQLEAIAASPEAQFEVRRKQGLGRMYRHRAAAAVNIRVPADANSRRMRDLPSGIVLAPIRLTVKFHGSEQLLSKLYELSQAVANDFDVFCETVDVAPDGTAPGR